MMKASETSMTSNQIASDNTGAFIVLDFSGDNLDPASLTSLIPLRPARTRTKGQPLGATSGGRARAANTGYCGFTTRGQTSTSSGDAHLQYLLEVVEDRLAAIRDIMAAQSLRWQATFFEGDGEGQSFADLSPEIRQRVAELSLPFLPKQEEAVTFVVDTDQSKP